MEATVTQPRHAKDSHQHTEGAGTRIFANYLVQPSHTLETHLRTGRLGKESGSPVTSPCRLTAREDFSPAEAGFEVDENVIAAFPDKGAVLISAEESGQSLWGTTAHLQVRIPSGEIENYFLKVVRQGETGRMMCHGEFESLKAVYRVAPGFCPKPYAWGRYTKEEAYFLLAQFRYVGHQPADASQLGEALANLHKKSRSPTGKFGFHMRTCHARIAQAVDFWDDSWCAVFKSHLSYVVDLAKPVLEWPEFNVVADLVVEKVVPRLLLPLQEEGRILKPCLVHGNCWDGNTAMDAENGAPFVFDVCSFYGHNEYDIGNWRAPRHRLSREPYVSNYKDHFEVSPPEEEWDSRNLLYSLPYNIGNAIYVPGSDQRPVIFEDMKQLCSMFCTKELASALKSHDDCSGDTPTASEKTKQHGGQETELVPPEIARIEEVEVVEEDDDSQVEEEELDREVIENLRRMGIYKAQGTCISPEPEPHNDSARPGGQWETQIEEPHESAIIVEDTEGEIVTSSRRTSLLGKVDAENLTRLGDSNAASAANDEHQRPATENVRPMAVKSTEQLAQGITTSVSAPAGGENITASSDEKKRDMPDAMLSLGPRTQLEWREQNPDEEALIENAEITMGKDPNVRDVNWEDVEDDMGNKNAKVMRKKQFMRRRKRRVLSGW